jgi:hypothetical protein
MTPEGYYYIFFTDNDWNLNHWTYSNFNSLVVHIPPEVTDLNVWVSAATDLQVENSTNYTRTRTWNWIAWSEWNYTCLNNYTWNSCENAPIAVSSWGGWWWGGGWWSYKQRISVKKVIKSDIVEVNNDIKNIRTLITNINFKTDKFINISKKLDNKILSLYKKFELYDSNDDIKNAWNEYIKAYEWILNSLLLIEDAWNDKSLLIKAKNDLKKYVNDFKISLKKQKIALAKIGKLKRKTFWKHTIDILDISSNYKIVDKIEWKIDLLVNNKLNKNFSNSYDIIKLRNNFLILLIKLVEYKKKLR